MDLQDKKILITGGSSGIGRATAEKLARLGARVTILGRTNAKVQDTIHALRKIRIDSHGIAVDLADSDMTAQKLREHLSHHGPFDILINNSGYAFYKTLHESPLEEVLHLAQANFVGTLLVSKLILDAMVSHQIRGHVLTVSSVAACLPITPCATYSMAKNALRSMSDLLSYEYEPFGITFSQVLPGRVDTPFFDHPSFARQHSRPENKGMLKATQVADTIVDSLLKGKTYVVIPVRFRFASWLLHAFPWVFKPLVGSILRKRIKDHHAHLGWSNVDVKTLRH